MDEKYLRSLPERVVRSAAALGGGLLRELTDVAIPVRLRRTRLYQSLAGSVLRYLIEQVGQVEGTYPITENRVAEDFLVRRMTGNGIELIGILTFRASPVWVLAALSDLSGAGRQLIQEIAAELKREGLIGPDATVETMDQLLDGLEAASGRLAESINTPPLDVAGLRAEWASVRKDFARIRTPRLPAPEDIRNRWAGLQAEAAAQNRSVYDLSSMMAMSAVQRLPENVSWLSKCTGLAARRTGKLFAGALLDHYDATLAEIRRQGFVAYWREQFRPYLKAAAAQFSKRPTV
ncbi:MAG: hypothetical protein ACRD8O_09980 [Bryobacteraceae bacterium]